MINLLRIFIYPGKVFAEMRTKIPIFPPLVTLVICLCVFPALQAWFVSEEEYARLNELAHEQTSEMNQQLAKTLGRFIVGQDEPDEKYEEFLKSQEQMLDNQLESLNSPESLRTGKKIITLFAPMSALFAYGVILLLEATYFLIAGNMMKCSKQWSEWIGFTLWSTMPLVIYLILYTAPTLWSGKHDPVGFQAPLSWLPGLESNVFALTLTISVLLTLWIRTIGMHKWVEKPIPHCLLIALIPTVVGWLISAGSLVLINPYAT